MIIESRLLVAVVISTLSAEQISTKSDLLVADRHGSKQLRQLNGRLVRRESHVVIETYWGSLVTNGSSVAGFLQQAVSASASWLSAFKAQRRVAFRASSAQVPAASDPAANDAPIIGLPGLVVIGLAAYYYYRYYGRDSADDRRTEIERRISAEQRASMRRSGKSGGSPRSRPTIESSDGTDSRLLGRQLSKVGHETSEAEPDTPKSSSRTRRSDGRRKYGERPSGDAARRTASELPDEAAELEGGSPAAAGTESGHIRKVSRSGSGSSYRSRNRRVGADGDVPTQSHDSVGDGGGSTSRGRSDDSKADDQPPPLTYQEKKKRDREAAKKREKQNSQID